MELVIVSRASTAVLLLILAVGPINAETLRVGGTGSAEGISGHLMTAFSATTGIAAEVVPGLGSGGGIAAVEAGVLGASVSARALTDVERARGLRSTPLLETPFIFVTSNTGRNSLSRSQIVDIIDGAMKTWPDGRAIKPILRPRSDSVSLFLNTNLDGMPAAMDKLRKRPDVPVAATDLDSLRAAEQIGDSFVGMTQLQFMTDKPRLRVIAIDGVEPSLDRMEDGSYPFRLTLYVVTRTEPLLLTQGFIDFLHTPPAHAIIREFGARPVSSRSAAAR